MTTINNIDVLAAIQSYLDNNNRPCPAHFLTDKFGDDVAEAITNLKKDGKIVGRRGRNGGIVFPDTVFKDKAPVKAKKVDIAVENTDSDTDSDSDSDDIEIAETPF
jgi:hypothetical protein